MGGRGKGFVGIMGGTSCHAISNCIFYGYPSHCTSSWLEMVKGVISHGLLVS